MSHTYVGSRKQLKRVVFGTACQLESALSRLLEKPEMTPEQKQDLNERGYLVLERFMAPEMLEAVQHRVDELFQEEGETAGSEFKQEPNTKRLANLVDKGEVFVQAIQVPEILECVEHVVGPEYKLSSVNVRSPWPYSNWVQPLHIDGGGLADDKGYYVCNSVWMLDDFTLENGAIRMVPGSHRRDERPQEVLSDPTAPYPGEVLLTGKARTVVVMNAHMWHGATANRTNQQRRAMHVYYTRRDKPQQLYQKKFLRPEVQSRLSSLARKVLALDDPENDRISSEITNISGFLK
jgi:ectoine hydroxylase-related dioxygenase (phytanoyl-CoA dioxygenase family)